MNKALLTAVAILALGVAPAFAESDDDGGDRRGGGHYHVGRPQIDSEIAWETLPPWQRADRNGMAGQQVAIRTAQGPTRRDLEGQRAATYDGRCAIVHRGADRAAATSQVGSVGFNTCLVH